MRREERRRQAQLLQIHRELQNVEVNFHVHLLLCLYTCLLILFFLSYSLHLSLSNHPINNKKQINSTKPFISLFRNDAKMLILNLQYFTVFVVQHEKLGNRTSLTSFGDCTHLIFYFNSIIVHI